MSQRYDVHTLSVQMTVAPTTVTTVLDPDSYDKGYNAGVADGHKTGKAEGYMEGHNEGFVAGETSGYQSGKSDGYAEGYGKGHTEGYTKGEQNGYDFGFDEGKKAEYDRFWDTFQQNGKRRMYAYAFSFGWDDSNFNPKYPLTGIGQVTYMFYYSLITNVDVDIEIIDNANSMFSQCSKLHTVKKLIVRENVPCNNTFYNCNELANITFEGVIGQSISFQYSPLTKESIMNVVEHLSSTASGKTCTFNKTAKEAAFTADEWATLIATKTNWTISLI